MDWLTCIRDAINYIEENLEKDINYQRIAEYLKVSPFILQHGFSVMTNCSIGEYIRNRRLYLAALDLKKTDDKIIDIAARYRYDNPDSFARAFTRFHGCSPNKAREGKEIRCFLPFSLVLTIKGGDQIEYRITQKDSFKIIGFERTFSFDGSNEEVPMFWKAIHGKYSRVLYSIDKPQNAIEKAVFDNQIGEFGVSIIDEDMNKYKYIISGRYSGGIIPNEMTIHEFPSSMWLVFDCVGPLPTSIQKLNTRLFCEWLPNNSHFDLIGNVIFERYNKNEDVKSPNYHSQIWIPVKEK